MTQGNSLIKAECPNKGAHKKSQGVKRELQEYWPTKSYKNKEGLTMKTFLFSKYIKNFTNAGILGGNGAMPTHGYAQKKRI